MAPRALSNSDLEALRGWPPEVAPSDLVEYFALDVGDLRWVRSHRGAATRLGLGVQLCALRFLGFVRICILSTTWYLQDATEAHQADGHEVGDEVIANISPGHFEALNPYGTHSIDVAAVLGRGQRRPLRTPRGP